MSALLPSDLLPFTRPTAKGSLREIPPELARESPLEKILLSIALAMSVMAAWWLAIAFYLSSFFEPIAIFEEPIGFFAAIAFFFVGVALIGAIVGVVSGQSWGWQLGMFVLAGSFGLSLWLILFTRADSWTVLYASSVIISVNLPRDLIAPALWDLVVFAALAWAYPEKVAVGRGQRGPSPM